MTTQPFNVLFLCTGNSARSIMAEAILNEVGNGRFHAYSAGSHPKGKVHPETLCLLQKMGTNTSDLRSKSWDEFAAGPPFDFIFTVCDNAAGEACPLWSGEPVTAHWSIPDPAAVKGTPGVVAVAFKDAYRALQQRISLFAALPLAALDSASLQTKLNEIAKAAARA